MNSKGRNPAADYTIGIYIRLSLADEDTGYGSKSESDSISNQRMLINRYLDESPSVRAWSSLMTDTPAQTSSVHSSPP